ncbi:hypothetical protein [Tumebacillus permanentifrigoris]|uniref:Uncharacterized protein n=1 Tax=Tumebacillus permanentifrigoris TaxID=378543 RepID=A0A316D3Z7_9BACL|nr:hypothetical protein [Tumebacillus permanentifrigoris]PWK06947.1 hypothetical protein C7459_11811 [Tumebacillus permanentifrigoris]
MTTNNMYASSFSIAQKIGMALGYAAARIEALKGKPVVYEGFPKFDLTGKSMEELAAINIDCALAMANLLNQVLPHLNDYEATQVLSLLGEDAQHFLA